MMRSFTIGVATLAAAALAVSGAIAQSRPTQPPPAEQKAMPGAEQPKPDRQSGQRIEGTIKNVDARGVVTLEDGTKLMIPKSVSVPKDRLKPGALITAEYEERGGQKVAIAVYIRS